MRRWAIALAMTAACAEACSLFLSSDEFTGGSPDAGQSDAPIAPPPAPPPTTTGTPPPPSEIVDAGPDADASDLVGAWFFDTFASVVPDVTGNGHDGILTQSAKISDAGGIDGGALALPTPGSFVVDSLAGTAFPSSGTLSIWFSYERTPPDNNQRHVFDRQDPLRAHIYVQHNGSSNAADIAVAYTLAADAGNVLTAVIGFVPGGYCHLVMTWDRGTRTGAVYMNGTQRAKETYAAEFVPTDQVFEIGDNFGGHIDEIRLWNRALSATEAAAAP